MRLFIPRSTPKHIAFDVGTPDHWMETNRKPIEEALKITQARIMDVVYQAIEKRVIMTSMLVLGSKFNTDFFPAYMDMLDNLLNLLERDPFIHENKIKISVLGKWYELPSKVVDRIKKILEATSKYDSHFLNLCIHYDGQEEIVDALRVLVRSLHYQKITPEQITKSAVKEHLYSSYFIPPELFIIAGKEPRASHFLLWDSPGSLTYFSKKDWCDFDKKAFEKALSFYKENA